MNRNYTLRILMRLWCNTFALSLLSVSYFILRVDNNEEDVLVCIDDRYFTISILS